MAGLYGTHAIELDAELKLFGTVLHTNVQEFYRGVKMLEQGVERSFEAYHTKANKLREALGMAKKDFKQTDWRGFIDVRMSDDLIDQYEAWDIHDSDVWDGLATYGERGYKFSLSYNAQSDNWVASYTGTTVVGANAGFTLSAFAGAPYEAARVLLFKVSCVLPDDWAEYRPPTLKRIG